MQILGTIFYFHTKLKDDKTKIGEEINDVMFADHDEIPWNDLAFNSIRVLLKKFFEVGSDKAISSFFNYSSHD